MTSRVKTIINEVLTGLDHCPQLIHLGDPILRRKTDPVSLSTGLEIARKLIKVMDSYRSFSQVGAGLAAPQIGSSGSVFVTLGKLGHEIYINPEIIYSSSEVNYYRESCLSSRAMWSDICRPESIELSWTNEHGVLHTEKFSGFKARLIQHEYDHLLGVPCLDRSLPGSIEYSGSVREERLRSSR